MGSINMNGKTVKTMSYKGKNVKSLSMNGKTLSFGPPPPVIPKSKMTIGDLKSTAYNYNLLVKLGVRYLVNTFDLYEYTYLGSKNTVEFPLRVYNAYVVITKFVEPTRRVNGYIEFELIFNKNSNCSLLSGIQLNVWYSEDTNLWKVDYDDSGSFVYQPSYNNGKRIKIKSFKPDTSTTEGYVQIELEKVFSK